MSLTSYRSVYAPQLLISAGGGLASDLARDVVSMEYTNDEMKGNELRLTVNNYAHKYTDDNRFAGGAKLRVRWGYPDHWSQVYQCIVVKARPHFTNGVPTLTVEAYDLRVEMNKNAHPKNWGPISSSDVARKLASEWNLDADIDESGDARRESRVQPANVTDIQYLLKLASPLNWDCYIDGYTLHFHPKRYDSAPEHYFDYFTGGLPTLIEFDPMVKMGRPSSSGKTGANAKNGSTACGDAKSGDNHGSPNAKSGEYVVNTESGTLEAIGTAPSITGLATGPAAWGLDGIGEVPYGTPVIRGERGQLLAYSNLSLIPLRGSTPESSDAVTKAQAKARQGRIDMKAVEATAKVIGTPSLKAKQMIFLRGVGKLYSGKWRVKEVRHILQPKGEVYVCHLKLTRNALGKGKKEDKASPMDQRGALSRPVGSPSDWGLEGIGEAPYGQPVWGNERGGYSTIGLSGGEVRIAPQTPSAPPNEVIIHT